MPSLRQKLKGAFSSKDRDINDYNSASQYSSPQTRDIMAVSLPALTHKAQELNNLHLHFVHPIAIQANHTTTHHHLHHNLYPHPFPTTAIQARCTPHQMDNSDPHHRHHVEMGMMQHSKSSIILSMFLRPLHCYMTVNLTKAEMSIKASNTFRLQLPTDLDPDLNRVTAKTWLQLLS